MILGPLSQAGLLGICQLRPPDLCSYPGNFKIVYCPFSRLLCLFGNDSVASRTELRSLGCREKETGLVCCRVLLAEGGVIVNTL